MDWLGAHVGTAQWLLQHLAIENHQGIERQVLSGGGHLALHRQPDEKGIDLRCPAPVNGATGESG